MLFYGITDIGMKRAVNQDSFRIKEYSPGVIVAVVCDGMGGARGGGVASSIAISEFMSSLEGRASVFAEDYALPGADEAIASLLREAVASANAAVFKAAYSTHELYGMGTTLVAVIVTPKRVYAVNVGDSRMYSRIDGEVTQVTRDHSYVQYLVDIGRISPQKAKDSPNKNIITRAVGTESEVEADVYTLPVAPHSGSSYALLCSDGLSNLVEPRELERSLSSLGKATSEDLQQASEALVSLACDRGGNDNITVVIIAY